MSGSLVFLSLISKVNVVLWAKGFEPDMDKFIVAE